MTATTIKEKPILFSAPMVRAILAGRKTMTRRVVKIQPDCKSWCNCVDYPNHDDRLYWAACYGSDETPNGEETYIRCPYGSPGDRLWVRETFRPIMSGLYEGGWDYRADDPAASGVGFIPWKPSIFMPRLASRITLQVEAVRVERLQEITEIDAQSEGVDWPNPNTDIVGGKTHPTCIDSFRVLWDKINGDGSWDANPFVWCVSFSVVKP